jgi:hypothetical protein
MMSAWSNNPCILRGASSLPQCSVSESNAPFLPMINAVAASGYNIPVSEIMYNSNSANLSQLQQTYQSHHHLSPSNSNYVLPQHSSLYYDGFPNSSDPMDFLQVSVSSDTICIMGY